MQQRALLIGIDKYPFLRPLEGCGNDVELMSAVLREDFGFPARNVRVLRDEKATRDEILAALDRLVDETEAGDIVVIHYSGHGAQMTDRENDEPSGYDSTIMPFDGVRDRVENKDITDDEIYLRVMRLGEKTPYTTMIFDACHSGTIARDAISKTGRSVKRDARPVSELPPSPIPAALQQRKRESGRSGWLPLEDSYVLISGCRDEELSYEYRDGQVMHGALTYFLCRELRSARSGTTYQDVFQQAAARITATNPTQHPQIEGRADREVFGVKEIRPHGDVAVLSREGETAVVGRGAAQGMTAGSLLSVYSESAKDGKRNASLGELEVTRVGVTDSETRILKERKPGTIVSGCRALETVHVYRDARLAVLLPPEEGGKDAKALRKLIPESPLLSVAEPGGQAAATVSVASGNWSVVSDAGVFLMPLTPLSEYRVVAQNLEGVARYRRALALENPDSASTLPGKVTLRLLRKDRDGKWIVAEPPLDGGHAVFEEGDEIAFRITNYHDRDLFVALIDFGLTGAIAQVPNATVKIRSQLAFDAGASADGHGYKLSLPARFPFARNPLGDASEGIETLKLFVTTKPASFAFMAQPGIRSTPPAVEQLWRTALGTTTRGEAVEKLPVGGDDWTTVIVSFIVRRRTPATA